MRARWGRTFIFTSIYTIYVCIYVCTSNEYLQCGGHIAAVNIVKQVTITSWIIIPIIIIKYRFDRSSMDGRWLYWIHNAFKLLFCNHFVVEAWIFDTLQPLSVDRLRLSSRYVFVFIAFLLSYSLAHLNFIIRRWAPFSIHCAPLLPPKNGDN